MKFIKQIYDWFKKKLSWLLYYITIIFYYGFGIFTVIFLSVSDKNVWPFLVIFIFITLVYFRKNLLSSFDIIKIGKGSFELRKVANETKNSVEELRKIALFFSIILSKMATKIGRIGTSFSIEELSEFKKEILELSKQINITEKDMNKAIQSLNNYILFDTLNKITKKYNGTSKVDICSNIRSQMIGNPALDNYNPNIDEIENYLKEKQELDDENIKILQEAKTFKEANYF